MAKKRTFKWGGRSWAGSESAEFRKWLASRGQSYKTWAAKNPSLAAVFAGQRPMTADRWANQAVSAAIDPQILALEQARAEERRYQSNLRRQQADISTGLAELLKGAGPAMQAMYGQAVGAQQALGSGFSDHEGSIQAAQNQLQGDYLRNVVGAPEGQVQNVAQQTGGEGLQDVLYGLGGYIPASTLNREGAGFTAQAQGFPGIAALEGLRNQRALTASASDADRQWRDRIREIRSTAPQVRREALQQWWERTQQQLQNDVQRKQLALQERALGLDEWKTQAGVTGYYTDAEGNVVPTYETVADAQDAATKGKKPGARAKQVEARNEEIVNATLDMSEWLEGQLKPRQAGTKTVNHPGGLGSTSTPVYETPKLEWARTFGYVYGQLMRRLRRYGLKPAKVRQLTKELLVEAGLKPPKKAKPPTMQPPYPPTVAGG